MLFLLQNTIKLIFLLQKILICEIYNIFLTKIEV